MGDPYLPFRTVFSLLVGEVEAGWLAAQRATWVRSANKDRSIIKPLGETKKENKR